MTGASALPPPGEAHLWCMDPAPFARADVARAWLARLPPEERARFDGYRFAPAAAQYLATRALVRTVVSRLCGTPVEALRFGAAASGRPELRVPVGPALRFSLSNTPGLVAGLFASGREVGVDVQAMPANAARAEGVAPVLTEPAAATTPCAPTAPTGPTTGAGGGVPTAASAASSARAQSGERLHSVVGVARAASAEADAIDVLELAERFFAPAETRELRALAEPERSRTFFAQWARKEAYLKARGLGVFDRPLAQISFRPAAGGGWSPILGPALAEDRGVWQIDQPGLSPRHAAATCVACDDGAVRVVVRWLAAEDVLDAEGGVTG